MAKNDFIRIINEEIENFDFLGNEKQQIEQENQDLIQNEDLQKQFICDSLLNNTKIKTTPAGDSSVGGNWDSDNFEDADTLTVEYSADVEYRYDSTKEPIKFNLYFYGGNVRIAVGGSYDGGNNLTQPSSDSWFYGIEWNDIEVNLLTLDGDTIKFLAFERAPINIKKLFLREFLNEYITNYTSMEIRDRLNNNAAVQYC